MRGKKNGSRLRLLYLLMTMEGLSMLGTRMTSISFGIWLYQSTQETTPILWIALFNELPAMLAGSLAGVWVDRLPKRSILLLADAGQALGSAVLIVGIGFGFFHVGLLYAVVLAQGVCAMFQCPAAQTVISMLEDEEQRDRVIGIREMLFPFAGVLAPACVGLLNEPFGLIGILLLDGITFLVSAVFLLSVRLPDEAKEESAMSSERIGGYEGIFGQLGDGRALRIGDRGESRRGDVVGIGLHECRRVRRGA